MLLRVAAVMLALSTTHARADVFVSPEFSKIDQIQVTISDGMRDGCWTNIGEFRRYVEDQLREKGYEVVDHSAEHDGYTLHFNALGDRKAHGKLCSGAITFTVQKQVEAEGISGELVAARLHGISSGYEKFNRELLESARFFVGALPGR